MRRMCLVMLLGNNRKLSEVLLCLGKICLGDFLYLENREFCFVVPEKVLLG
jgi:hypothetical protein